MGKCTKRLRKIRRVCTGSLNRRIVLYNRAITAPSAGSTDYGEEFTSLKTVWSMIDTVRGVVLFDKTNTERDISHNIFIRYFASFEIMFETTAETWVGLIPVITGMKESYLNIIRVENLDQNNRFLMLSCALRGDTTVPANFA